MSELSIPRSIEKPVRGLLFIQKVILVFCSSLMAIVFFLVVILRYVFEADLFAYEEWVLMAAFWLYFIGGAQGSYEGTHIKADFIKAWIKHEKIKWILANFTLALEVFVGVVLSYWGYLMVMEDIVKYPEWPMTVAWRIPFFVPRFGIFLGLVLMTFYTSLHLYNDIKRGPNWEHATDLADRI